MAALAAVCLFTFPAHARDASTHNAAGVSAAAQTNSPAGTRDEKAPVETKHNWSPVQLALGPFQVPPKAWDLYGLGIDCFIGSSVNRMIGLQTGFAADADDVSGFQLAVLGNSARTMNPGLQAGLFNQVEKEMVGIQTGFIAEAADVSGIQMAVIGNLALTVNPGLQAGLINRAERRMVGMQIGLVNNMSSWVEHHRGPNVNERYYVSYGNWRNYDTAVAGLQLAVFSNCAGGMGGLQASCVFNESTSDVAGLQVSLFNNAKDTLSGAQLGFVNLCESGTVNGLQFGFLNNGGTVRGLQIGVINVSKTLKGVQVGLWNRCTSSKLSGLPLVRAGF